MERGHGFSIFTIIRAWHPCGAERISAKGGIAMFETLGSYGLDGFVGFDLPPPPPAAAAAAMARPTAPIMTALFDARGLGALAFAPLDEFNFAAAASASSSAAGAATAGAGTCCA